MIGALARGGAALNRDDYTQAAQKAAAFVVKRLRASDGRLLRTWRADQAKIPGYLEDYAYLAQGLLALHETTNDERWLRAARAICDEQIRLFWDADSKGFYFTASDHEALIARTRNAFDAVLPSGNAVSARNLIRLASITGEPSYRERARETLEAFAPALARSPRSAPQIALALGEYLATPDSRTDRTRSEALVADEENAVVQTAAKTPAKPGSRDPDAKVSAKPFLSVEKLPAGATCEVLLFVTIQDGWHIQPNKPEAEWQSPTELTMTSKLGTQLIDVKYPRGKPQRVVGSSKPLLVYEKEAVIRGVFKIPESAAGKTEEIRLVLSFQPCDKAVCKAPTKVAFSGSIPVAAVGEPVKEKNANLFRK
jgi:hypothetical protein